jgi:hypothetical protein
LLRSESTRSVTVWQLSTGLRCGLGIRVTHDSDRSAVGNCGLVIPGSDVWSWTELRLEVALVAVLRSSSVRIHDVLRSSEVQACREWSDRSSVFGTSAQSALAPPGQIMHLPSTESFSTHERSIPDNVDVLATDSHDHTLHAEGYAS